jgi:biotin carboxyl carrier protein
MTTLRYEITITGKDGAAQSYSVELSRAKDGVLRCRVNGEEVKGGFDAQNPEREIISMLVGNQSYEVKRDLSSTELQVIVGEERFTADVRDPRSLKARRAQAGASEGPKKITAPMPGKVVRIIAQAGSEVEAGDGVIVIEAMKMQNELKAPKAGKVTKIAVAEGTTVNPGETLAIVE